jgi:hypothetical protein
MDYKKRYTPGKANHQQQYERYVAIARDAALSGDRVLAEHYYQHAEHFFRTLNERGNDRPSSASSSVPPPVRTITGNEQKESIPQVPSARPHRPAYRAPIRPPRLTRQPSPKTTAEDPTSDSTVL